MLKRFLISIVVLGAFLAWAADEGKCVLPVNVNSSISSTACQNTIVTLADGGSQAYSGDGGFWCGSGSNAYACQGVTMVVQCNVDVCFDPTATAGGVASCTNDFKIEFTNNKDPAYIYLKPTQRDVAFIAASADGGCVLGATDRRKPL